MKTLVKSKYKIVSEVIHYDIVDLYMIEPGILVSEYKMAVELDLNFMLEVNRQMAKLTNGKAVPQLFIACPGLGVTKEMRDWGVTEAANKYTLVSAVVCNSLAHKILGNFIIKVQKPPRPIKMFSSVEDAHKWLSSTIN